MVQIKSQSVILLTTVCRGTGVSSEQFSEKELIIPVVNNASHAVDAVPSAHSQVLWIPLVCRQVGKEREVILSNNLCDTRHLRTLWHFSKALHSFKAILPELTCIKMCFNIICVISPACNSPFLCIGT